MKTCTTCDVEKPIDNFYKNPNSRGGYLTVCKPCEKTKQKEYKIKNKDKIDKYNEEYKKRDEYKSGRVKYSKEYRAKNSEKDKAHTAVKRAIMTGKIIRPNKCEECGNVGKVDAHHNDYTKRLDVRFLCRSCHKLWHSHEKIKHENEFIDVTVDW